MVGALRARGYRVTPQRLAIVRALLAPDGHPSAEAVYQRVAAENPTLSPATVYKTLDVLKAIGEVRELELGEGHCRFDAARTSPHPHLLCRRCRRVDDLDAPEVVEQLVRLSRRAGYRPRELRLVVLGLCPACQRHPA